MRKLNHRYIVKIHDVILDTQLNNIYFVMDYYENGDLAKFLNKKPLKEKFARKYIKQLSEGLKYLLENKIVHRDLKPQNILLSNNYDIKITDFGFATYYNDNTIINTLCGSPMYMAPEIITRNGYNHKSDLWSVGIILYEMIHGYTPFDVTNFIDLIKEIKKTNIEINYQVSDECKSLILSLCKVNPQERIEWNLFFKHKWFDNDEIMEDENKLLDIDFNSSISNLNNNNNNKPMGQFCSFIHKSVADTEGNLELNFLENSYNSSSSSGEEYLSAESENSSISDLEESNIQDFVNVSKPIDIINNHKNHNDFVLVNQFNINPSSLPLRRKTLTDSFREYLYSSIKIIKDSYHYISNNSV